MNHKKAIRTYFRW